MTEATPLQLSGCAIIQDEKLLLLHRIEQNHYEFPGGKVEADESLEAAAKREVQEELGVEVNIIRYLGSIIFAHPQTGRQLESHKYLAEIAEGQEPYVVETNKFSELKWIPMQDYAQYNLAPNAREFCARWLRGEYNSEYGGGEVKR